MPLAFESLSHGTIAFGFFNIESDMLLLEHYFFFADLFCDTISGAAQWTSQHPYESMRWVYDIPDPRDMGDLMGAIHGVVYTGFIGEFYRRFPFPSEPEGFKQKAEGFRTRRVVEELIQKYARRVEISFSIDRRKEEIHIGEYRFDRTAFQGLIDYVWLGGYPGWRDDQRPDYVLKMKESLGRRA